MIRLNIKRSHTPPNVGENEGYRNQLAVLQPTTVASGGKKQLHPPSTIVYTLIDVVETYYWWTKLVE